MPFHKQVFLLQVVQCAVNILPTKKKTNKNKNKCIFDIINIYLKQELNLIEPATFRGTFDLGLKCSRRSAKVCGKVADFLYTIHCSKEMFGFGTVQLEFPQFPFSTKCLRFTYMRSITNFQGKY